MAGCDFHPNACLRKWVLKRQEWRSVLGIFAGILAANLEIEGIRLALGMRCADDGDGSRKSTSIDNSQPPEAARPTSARRRVGRR